MTPGLLDDAITVSSLKRISPSRYSNLRECVLREALSAERVPLLLPSSPAARLGSIIHLLLEEAGKGRLSATRDAVERRWDSLVEELESKLGTNWLESSCVPFGKPCATTT